MVLLWSAQIFAHGVEGTVQPGGLAVTCRYSTGEPMDYAKVTVLAPGSSQPFQVGHTDKNGRFCFFPDAPGEWRVTAEDGMGHRLEVKVPVTQELVQGAQVKTAARTITSSLFERALVGLSLIFGIAGLLFYWRAVRIRR
jgi:nickel transport protein